MQKQEIKELQFKSAINVKENVIVDNADYSKSELHDGRASVDPLNYITSFYEFKIKNKHLQVILDYVNSIDHFYHEEFDVPNHPTYRHCELAFPNERDNSEIYKIISGIFKQINEKNFKYDLFGTVEIQIIKYKVGGNYNWHCDYGLSQNPNGDRKLSLSLQLSDENEYEGCDLILCDYSRIYRIMSRKIGHGMVFDSRSPHKVTNLTKGVRYCLVAWAHGPQLR